MNETISKVVYSILDNGNMIGNCVVIKKNDGDFYGITAGHVLFDDKNEFKPLYEHTDDLRIENGSLKYKINSILTDDDFARSYELAVFKIEGIVQNLPAIDICTRPNTEQYKFRLHGAIPNYGFNTWKNLEYDISFEVPYQGGYNVQIDKASLEDNEFNHGAEWMEGVSGSGLFVENTLKPTCCGILIEIPNKGNLGRLRLASFDCLQDCFDHILPYEDLGNRYLSKCDLDVSLQNSFLKNIIKNDKIIPLYYEYNRSNGEYELEIFLDIKRNTLEEIFKDCFKDNDVLVITGNPGSGKSEELKRFAIQLWEESDDFIPVYRNLRNFTINHTFEQYTDFSEIEKYDKIIFILDSIDEMSEIQHFIKLFNVFREDQTLKGRSVKYILSCRSNTYRKFSFPDQFAHKMIKLSTLIPEKYIQILSTTYGVDLKINELNKLQHELLSTPFFVRLFALYYKEKKCLPTNRNEIWNLFIDSTFNEHTKKFLTREEVFKQEIISNLKKIAFINELMQKNYCTEDELYEVFNKDYKSFIENPFFDSESDEYGNWVFTHRQIQEFIVSKVLSELSFEQLKAILLIEDTTLHPSYFNVVSFLMDQLYADQAKQTQLIELFIEKELDVIFKSDSDRISEQTKIQIFQKYFIEECENKSQWIGGSLSTDEIANFGNNEENFLFLLKYAGLSGKHFRARISAIDLIQKMDLPLSKTEYVKDSLLLILNNVEEPINIRTAILYCIMEFKFHEGNTTLINDIFDIFRENEDERIKHALLGLILNESNIDDWFPFILKEFESQKDYDLSGNKYLLEEAVLKLKIKHHFIQIISLHWKSIDKWNDEYFVPKLIERYNQFSIGNEEKQIIELLDQIGEGDNYYFSQGEFTLRKIINENKVQLIVFSYFIEKNKFSESKWFLATMANEECIQFLIDSVDEYAIELHHLEGFRNILLSHNNYACAKYLEDGIKLIGINFIEKIPEPDYREVLNQNRKKTKQENFDLLFNNEGLWDKVNTIFTTYDTSQFSHQSVRAIERKFNEENKYSLELPEEINVLLSLTFKYRPYITIEFTKSKIEEPIFILNRIKESLEKNYFKQKDIEISESKKQQIIDLVKRASSDLDINDLILHRNDGFSFETADKQDRYNSLKTIMVFYSSEIFDFDLDKGFLLDAIEYFDIEKSDNLSNKFSDFLKSINDEKAVNERIIENLSKDLFPFSFSRHAFFALENNMFQTYPFIDRYFRNNKSIYPGDKLFHYYVELTKDYEMLKFHCEDLTTVSGWTCIELLLELDYAKHKEFCQQKSKQYLDTEEMKDYNEKALRILFKTNHEDALDYLMTRFDAYSMSRISHVSYKDYSVLKNNDYNKLRELFELTFDPAKDRFELSSNQSFFNTYLANLSKDQDHYQQIKAMLDNIAEENRREGEDVFLFYANSIMDTLKKNHINAMSKPMDFKSAFAKMQEVIQ